MRITNHILNKMLVDAGERNAIDYCPLPFTLVYLIYKLGAPRIRVRASLVCPVAPVVSKLRYSFTGCCKLCTHDNFDHPGRGRALAFCACLCDPGEPPQ